MAPRIEAGSDARRALADRLGAARLIAALGRVLPFGDHNPTPERTHDRAVLLVPARLDVDDPAVWLGCRLLYLEYGRLAVDRVAVKRRCQVAQRLDLEVGDRLARHIGHGHAEK